MGFVLRNTVFAALHPPISPLTSSGQRNCASWASKPQKSVTLLPCPGGRTTKTTRTRGGIGPNQNILFSSYKNLLDTPCLRLEAKLPSCDFYKKKRNLWRRRLNRFNDWSVGLTLRTLKAPLRRPTDVIFSCSVKQNPLDISCTHPPSDMLPGYFGMKVAGAWSWHFIPFKHGCGCVHSSKSLGALHRERYTVNRHELGIESVRLNPQWHWGL